MKDITTIQIEKDIREQLKQIGTKAETYSDIIKRLIKKEMKR